MKKLKKYQIGGFPRLTPETIEYLKSLNNPKIGNYNIGVDEDIQAPLQAKLNTKKNKGLLNDSIISTEKEDWEKDYTSNKDNYQLKFDTSLIGVQNNGGDRRKYSAFIKDKYDIDVPTGNPQFADYMNVGKGLVYGATALTNELGEVKNRQSEKEQYIKSLQPTLFEDEFVQNTQPAYAKYGFEKFPDGGKIDYKKVPPEHLIISRIEINKGSNPNYKLYQDTYGDGRKDITYEDRKTGQLRAVPWHKNTDNSIDFQTKSSLSIPNQVVAKYQIGGDTELEEMKTGGIPERYKKMGFTSVNSPKKTPSASKSHAVVVKDGSNYKLIRFGQQGVSGSPKKEGESESYKNRRESFKARHAANIAKGKTSAAYWSNRVKW